MASQQHYGSDGDCDDGGLGFEFTACLLGTDATDCGSRQVPNCVETCNYAGDGQCDDGGPGAEFSSCEFGADCTDCTARSQEDADVVFTSSDAEVNEVDSTASSLFGVLFVSIAWLLAACSIPYASDTIQRESTMGRDSTAIGIKHIEQLFPSRKALQRENKYEFALLCLDVWCILMRWVLLVICAWLISFEFHVRTIACSSAQSWPTPTCLTACRLALCRCLQLSAQRRPEAQRIWDSSSNLPTPTHT